MLATEIEWLIDCTPREVQQEAILRSFYGWKNRSDKHSHPDPVKMREGPARGWGHFLEMRLGKTPTLLNEFALFEVHHDIRCFVILSPNSYKQDWVNEAKRFGMGIPFFAYETSRAKDAMDFIDKNKSGFGLVVNYEALQYDNTKEILHEIVNEKCALGADESIKIKNPNSITTKEALRLSKNAAFVRELTGCPMTQGPQDMYSQLRFIGGLDGKNFYSFRNRFCVMGGFKNKQIKGPKNEEELKEIIDSHGFVAKRREWGNPTVPEYYTINLDLDPVQKKYYEDMDEDFITWLESGEEIKADQVISKMLKLQQISSGFVYTEEGEAIDLMPFNKTPKMKKLLELFEETNGKIIVPYHYSKSGDALMEVLASYNPAVIRSKQWMIKNDRDVVKEKTKFNNDSTCRVMILQISAGKYGHDLSGVEGNRCSHMVFYENTFSLDDRTQIEMRNTAASQDWQNLYLDFVSSPVEMKAITALARKENIITAVLGAYNQNKTRIEK
jgi:hypothetical protein